MAAVESHFHYLPHAGPGDWRNARGPDFPVVIAPDNKFFKLFADFSCVVTGLVVTILGGIKLMSLRLKV